MHRGVDAKFETGAASEDSQAEADEKGTVMSISIDREGAASSVGVLVLTH